MQYVHKYFNTDLTKIREKVVNQCNWQIENEPAFAPDLKEFNDYGEWFDNKIKFSEYED